MASSTTNHRNNNKKSVEFKRSVKVFKVQRLAQDEVEVKWYTKKDFLSFKISNTETIKLMASAASSSGAHTNDVFCTRGLEPKTTSRMNRATIRKAVLKEQSYQRKNGCRDPQALAQISRGFSEESEQHAHRLALKDERYVREYVKEDATSQTRYGDNVQSSKISKNSTIVPMTRRRSVAGAAA